MAKYGDEVSITAACPSPWKTCQSLSVSTVSRAEFADHANHNTHHNDVPDGDGRTQNSVFNRAFGSSVSIRFKSCENRFVTTPVSVLVKKARGARINVRRVSWWTFAPARLTEMIKIEIPSKSSEIKADT